MRLLVVFNRFARSGRAGKNFSAVKAEFQKHPVEAEFVLTRQRGDATKLVAASDASKFDAVVAVGGDGTVFESVNGIMLHAEDERLPMGIVPMGTGNAFARDFGWYAGQWKQSVERICQFRTSSVDVGEITGGDEIFHFLNIAGIGFATNAGLAARKLKFIGNAAYTVGTLWETLRLKSYPLTMFLDGKQYEQQNVFVEVSNSRFTGTRFLMAPEAKLDDGYLDVTILRKLSRLRLLRLFPTIFSGRHVEFDEIESIRSREIRISSPQGMVLTVDGEFRGKTPVTIRCLPSALDLLV